MEKLMHYCRDWGEWPSQRGHTNQVRMFFAREPQTAGLNGDGLSFARHMFNYTTTFQRDADIFYPYGHAEKLATPKNITLPGKGLFDFEGSVYSSAKHHSVQNTDSPY